MHIVKLDWKQDPFIAQVLWYIDQCAHTEVETRRYLALVGLDLEKLGSPAAFEEWAVQLLPRGLAFTALEKNQMREAGIRELKDVRTALEKLLPPPVPPSPPAWPGSTASSL